jgi:hypothetical protein
MQDWSCTTEEFFSFEGLAADDSWLDDSPPSFFQE